MRNGAPWPRNEDEEDSLTLEEHLAMHPEDDLWHEANVEANTAQRRAPGGPDWTPPRRETLTEAGVDRLKPKRKRYAKSDPDCRGHWIRVEPSGAKSCYAMAYDPNGKQVWARLGPFNAIDGGLKGAREKARKAVERIKAGLSAIEEVQGQTFKEVAELWMKLHVEKKELLSKQKNKGCWRRYSTRDGKTARSRASVNPMSMRWPTTSSLNVETRRLIASSSRSTLSRAGTPAVPMIMPRRYARAG
jgi:hypothetical protein